MNFRNNDINQIQRLVGPISQEDLKHVDYWVSDDLGVFIPSVGFCGYAITPQHVHPAYSFILFFSKEQSLVPISIEIEPEHYPGVAIAPDIPHEEDASGTFTRYIALFVSRAKYEKCHALYWEKPPEKYNWTQFAVNRDIMFYIKKFIAERERGLPGCDQVLANLADIVIHQLVRSFVNLNCSDRISTSMFEIEQVIAYLHQHYSEKLSVNSMARLARMSTSNFARVFKKETGLAPMEYLIKVRLEKAKALLRSGHNITEVSLNCGFSSISHFSSCFSGQLGLSPSDYQSNYIDQKITSRKDIEKM